MKSIRKPSEPHKVDTVPQVPFRFPANMWRYEPRGPHYRFELYHGEVVGRSPQIFEVWDGFDAALDRFTEYGLPQWWHCDCFLLDSAGIVVLGYRNSIQAQDLCGPYGWWIGVEAAFRQLEQRHDPIEVAVWETMAREVAW